jgi:hypothetical protein
MVQPQRSRLGVMDHAETASNTLTMCNVETLTPRRDEGSPRQGEQDLPGLGCRAGEPPNGKKWQKPQLKTWRTPRPTLRWTQGSRRRCSASAGSDAAGHPNAVFSGLIDHAGPSDEGSSKERCGKDAEETVRNGAARVDATL